LKLALGLAALLVSSAAQARPAHFVLVHSLSGQAIEINADAISQLGQARKDGLLIDAGCVVVFTNGKFLSTRETCPEIMRLIDGNLRSRH